MKCIVNYTRLIVVVRELVQCTVTLTLSDPNLESVDYGVRNEM